MASSPNPSSPDARPSAPRSIMHSLGAFVGHIIKAARTDVTPGQTRSAQVAGARVEAGGPLPTPGTVTLRRTVVEEVEIRPIGTHEGMNPSRPKEGGSP